MLHAECDFGYPGAPMTSSTSSKSLTHPRGARLLTSALTAITLAALSSGGCSMVMSSLPTTPRLQALNEDQVFSMAPPPEWPQPQADNPANAPVDIACGVGPRTTTNVVY